MAIQTVLSCFRDGFAKIIILLLLLLVVVWQCSDYDIHPEEVH